MIVGFDSAAIITATPPPNPIPPRRDTAIQAPPERHSGAERRSGEQAKDKPSFRAMLEAVADASTRSLADDLQARRAQRAAAAQDNARIEKRPSDAPTELSADEGERLYAERLAAQKRAGVADAGEAAPLKVPSSPEFFLAAARYAERLLAAAYARPGESLELSA